MACREDATSDCCRPAVVRAYQEMRGKGQPEKFCLEAAITVYRWHHPSPDNLPPEVMAMVTGWVHDGLRH
ncbi:hypothetical protein [Nitrospirillum viridazoti]|uniref:Uncharacterized protein n=2 Tax=Nitrospirillum TaxID=1543705 RepID=A0A248JS27_9PROT|nr:hypothetical protein [Nitrospirillum amazonense]ASG21533.1 hypothetical protein Y958_12465 [Nitrospirillum amazonense CBAmc]TWB42333.1 hypothetical protein FBZ91_103352 [Nitrospirillum amazonense]TWB46318.1 hypothetical protein FBZ92_1554 [Nitrospirillum amazonense]